MSIAKDIALVQLVNRYFSDIQAHRNIPKKGDENLFFFTQSLPLQFSKVKNYFLNLLKNVYKYIQISYDCRYFKKRQEKVFHMTWKCRIQEDVLLNLQIKLLTQKRIRSLSKQQPILRKLFPLAIHFIKNWWGGYSKLLVQGFFLKKGTRSRD